MRSQNFITIEMPSVDSFFGKIKLIDTEVIYTRNFKNVLWI